MRYMPQSEHEDEYIRSERFLHDSLLRRAENMVEEVVHLWQAHRTVTELAFAWPSRMIFSDAGVPIDGLISMQLPERGAKREAALQHLVLRTQAYGLFVIEALGNTVKVFFETPHGARVWSFRVRQSMDLKVLSRPTVSDDTESIGLLWKKDSAKA